MGRFETTAASYAAHREPYPAAFFAAAAERLGLTGREALIDLGTGPGLLALGFAPYVARIVGVDPEPAMVAAAREAASAAGVAFEVRLGRAETVADGGFDLVTIGRALHWMERAPTLAALDRMLGVGGRILVCGPRMAAANPWRGAFEQVTKKWSSGGEADYRRAHLEFFDGSRFLPVGDIHVEHRQEIDVEALIERALTRSTTSPAALGDGIEAFRAEMRDALAPFFPGAAVQEVIETRARVYMRTGE